MQDTQLVISEPVNDARELLCEDEDGFTPGCERRAPEKRLRKVSYAAFIKPPADVADAIRKRQLAYVPDKAQRTVSWVYVHEEVARIAKRAGLPASKLDFHVAVVAVELHRARSNRRHQTLYEAHGYIHASSDTISQITGLCQSHAERVRDRGVALGLWGTRVKGVPVLDAQVITGYKPTRLFSRIVRRVRRVFGDALGRYIHPAHTQRALGITRSAMLALIGLGYDRDQLSDSLGISPRQVHHHLRILRADRAIAFYTDGTPYLLDLDLDRLAEHYQVTNLLRERADKAYARSEAHIKWIDGRRLAKEAKAARKAERAAQDADQKRGSGRKTAAHNAPADPSCCASEGSPDDVGALLSSGDAATHAPRTPSDTAPPDSIFELPAEGKTSNGNSTTDDEGWTRVARLKQLYAERGEAPLSTSPSAAVEVAA